MRQCLFCLPQLWVYIALLNRAQRLRFRRRLSPNRNFRENVMDAQTFSTLPLPVLEQFEAWCRWYRPAFEVQPLRPLLDGFPATNWNWTLNGLTVSRIHSPPA